MPNILDEIVLNKQSEVAALKSSTPLAAARPSSASGTFLSSLRKPGIRLITEIKPKSPSGGVLNASFDLSTLVSLYSKYAAAISILTDIKYFGGTLETLATASSLTPTPTLCKDFIIDPIQVDFARMAGAEAVLLIVKILSDEQLTSLHAGITALGMTAVVEIQNEEELDRATTLDPACILINNRNLETFNIDLQTTFRLAPFIRELLPTATIISASGIESRSDIEFLLPHTNVFLVGSSLMKATDIEAKLRELIQC